MTVARARGLWQFLKTDELGPEWLGLRDVQNVTSRRLSAFLPIATDTHRHGSHHLWTSTGILECVSTLIVCGAPSLIELVSTQDLALELYDMLRLINDEVNR